MWWAGFRVLVAGLSLLLLLVVGSLPFTESALVAAPISVSQTLFIGQGTATTCFNHGVSSPCTFSSNRNYFLQDAGTIIQNASTTLAITGPLSGSGPNGNWSFQMNTYAPSTKIGMGIMQFVMQYSSGVMNFHTYYVLTNDGNPFTAFGSTQIPNSAFTTGTSMTIQLITNSTGNILGAIYQVKLSNGTFAANLTLLNQFGFLVNGFLGTWQTYAAPMVGWQDMLAGYSLDTSTFTKATGTFSYSASTPIASTITFPSQLPFVAYQGIGSIEHSNLGYSAPSDQAAITTSSTSISPCPSCSSTTTTQVNSFNPAKISGFFGQDRGPFSSLTALNGFTWNKTSSDSLTMGVPSINGLPQTNAAVFFNSSLTSWQFSGVNFFFKPSGYHIKIQIQGNVAAPTTISLSLSSSSSAAVCDTPSCTAAQFGSEIFDWSDLAAFTPAYNNLTHALTFIVNGAFNIDPLALDGSGKCNNPVGNTCSFSLTTSSSPDDIVVFTSCNTAGSCSGAGHLPTASGLTFSNRATKFDGGFNYLREDYAVASGTLSALSITCNGDNQVSCVGFGVSGADTSTIWDSNGALPCESSGNSNSPSCTISTSNANDFLIEGLSPLGATCTQDPTFTLILSDNCAGGTAGSAAAYKVVSATQSGVSVTWSLGASVSWVMIADAIKALSSVTQKITITTLPAGAPSATITLVNCGYTNSTFTADGFTHTYTGVTAACATTLRNPAATTQRYGFNIWVHPTFSRNANFTTPNSGTGTYSNNTYDQVQNTYTANPQNPNTWDAIYGWQITGTYLGVANAATTCTNTANGGGSVSCSNSWYDYNLAVNLPAKIGNSWIAQAPSSFTDTTGGHTHTTNYIQSSGGGGSSNYLWLLLIPVVLSTIVLLSKRRRLR